jgi:uncharacterized coiled-coil protein SlyX
MTTPPDQAPSTGSTRPISAPSASRSGGCFGRLFAALLVIVLAVGLALAAGVGGLLFLGFTANMPAELADARARAAELETRQALQATEIASGAALQATEIASVADRQATEVASVARRVADEAEALADLQAEVLALQGLRAELDRQMAASALQSATLVTDARTTRDQVAAFATAEAGRVALLAEIDRRSARVERFLQRLSDIAEDTAIDLGATTPTIGFTPATTTALTSATSSTALPPATPTPTVAPTRTPPPTPTVQVTSMATPTGG